MKKPASVDEYLARFPASAKRVLEQIRRTILQEAPQAEESVSYGIAAYKWQGKVLIYFAGFTNHISIYPRPRTDVWTRKLKVYKGGKGTIQFPLDKPVPLGLVAEVTRYHLHRIQSTASPTSKNRTKGKE